MIRAGTLSALMVLTSSVAVAAEPGAILWYDKPTTEYMSGQPLGNGQIGAMILGEPGHERVALNHQWLWRGKTRDRQQCVERFQNDEQCKLFLISLKAGGLGLNLTAADYVFLLDPWWNPAVEAQAIDRTHRIGQTRNVMAYRLLIKDSIEEKIRQLQKQKSALVEDVLGEEKFAQALTLADLQFLFAD